MKKIRIGTRESKLAVVQAEMVADHIRGALPDADVGLVTMKTTGDRFLDRTLDKIGGKGLFVKELDEALRRGDVDICVHSYKDLPGGSDAELPIVAVSRREDPRDVLILPAGVDRVDVGKPVGCSSQRRQVQLEQLYPGQPFAPVRGNVLTRLRKLDEGQYSALVLAAAGIKRLGLWDRVSRVFEPEEMLPAGCQGAIAVQGRKDQDYGYLEGFRHVDTRDATLAERAFVERLNCGCGAPVGVFATVTEQEIRVRGMIGDRGTVHRDEIHGDREQARQLGRELAEKMLKKVDVQWADMVTSS